MTERAKPDSDEDDADPQLLLPESLRGDWVVITRRSANRLMALCGILGIGLGLATAGVAFGPPDLTWGLLLSLLVFMGGARLFVRRYDERKLRELGVFLAGKGHPIETRS